MSKHFKRILVPAILAVAGGCIFYNERQKQKKLVTKSNPNPDLSVIGLVGLTLVSFFSVDILLYGVSTTMPERK